MTTDAMIRKWDVVTITIAASATTSEAVDLRKYAFGCYELPAAMTGTAMNWTVAVNPTGTFAAAADEAGTALTSATTAANAVLPIPADVMRCGAAKFVSGSTEAAARTIRLYLAG